MAPEPKGHSALAAAGARAKKAPVVEGRLRAERVEPTRDAPRVQTAPQRPASVALAFALGARGGAIGGDDPVAHSADGLRRSAVQRAFDDRSAGRPLEAEVRTELAGELGRDFGEVRVHADRGAARLAADVEAHAFTRSNDIYFGAGRYEPGTETGRRLLRHELGHVAQQARGEVSAYAGQVVPREHASEAHATSGSALRAPKPAAGGARASIQRQPSGGKVAQDVLSTSIGEDFAKSLTKTEMREQVALLVNALQAPGLDPADQETYEQNLEVLERFAAAHKFELPLASGFRVQQVIRTLAADCQAMLAIDKDLIPGSDYDDAYRMLGPQLKWSVYQLDWLVDTLSDTAELTLAAQAGGPKSAEQFRKVGVNLTAMIFSSKIVAVHQSYLRVAFAVFGHLPYDILTKRIENTRDILEPHLILMKMLSPPLVELGVAGLLGDDLSWDFSVWKDEIEDAMKSWRRFTGVLNIAMLAMTAFDIWALPTVGPGGAPPPTIGGGGFGGAGGAGAAVGVLESAESLEAIRQLVAIGAVSSKGVVKALGGRGITVEGPPEPALSAPKDPKAAGGKPGSARPGTGLPTPEEDLVVRRYARGLADLRERLGRLRRLEAEIPRDARAVERARASYESADRELQAIEDEATQRIDGELVDHLEPLTRARTALKQGGTVATETGARIPAKAVERAPDLRGMDFADIEKAIGRPPDFVSPASKPPGGGLPSGHQRLGWKFEDGSQLIIDDPRALGGRAASADLPHAELWGPNGERLDQQGIQVPEQSISAHMTITDYTRALEDHFGPARAGK